jgi:hypothetical protein
MRRIRIGLDHGFHVYVRIGRLLVPSIRIEAQSTNAHDTEEGLRFSCLCTTL